MKLFIAIAAAYLVLVSASQAVVWISATVASKVIQGPVAGALTTTTLSTAKYIQEGARRQGDPTLKNYFVGIRTTDGLVAVVHIPTKTISYTINSAPAVSGSTANGTGSAGTVGGTSNVSSLNVDATGFVLDKFVKNIDGSFKSISRVFMGATPGLTISGTVRSGSKRFDL